MQPNSHCGFARSQFGCAILTEDLEWVGRSLADVRLRIVDSKLIEGERKVRTPKGSGLANGQTGQPDDKCNRE